MLDEVDELAEDNHEGDAIEALTAEEQPAAPKKTKDKVLEESSLTGVFTTPEQNDPLKMLFTPGTVVNNLLMRGNHLDRRMVVAACHILSQCEEFNDPVSRKECMMVLSGTCGIKAERAQMLVDAYVGQQNQKSRKGVGEWIREKAGFGSEEKGSQ